MDLTLIAFAFPLAYAVRDGLITASLPGLYPIARYWPIVALSLLLWIGAASIARVYDVYRTRSITSELFRMSRAVGVQALLVAAAGFLLHQHDVSRLLVGIYLVISWALLGGSRVVVRLVAHAVRRRGYNTRTFAVVGTDDLSLDLHEALLSRAHWGYEFAGFVLDGAPPPEKLPGKVLGSLDELAQVLERHVIDLVVISAAPDRMKYLERAVAVCDEQGVPVKLALDLLPARDAHIEVEELEGIPLLSLASGPQDLIPLLAKRAFDITLSVLGLALLSPLLAIVAIAVRLDSPGPVLFRQRRVGLNGREFTLYKFRSMRVGAEDELHALRAHNEADGPVFKMREDPRVTGVGRFIRRMSIDELPQLWNVLRGEMSVVGPRPPIPEEVRRYQRWQRRRLSMKPGITCTWQVSGRSDLEFDRWMELDLAYIDSWSLWGDLQIVARTIPAVLLRRGAR
ncbi:MAG TPA: sugar transferase [Anaeromyxobacter sp.]|nr:sugar transferase [Anaeromyxobacter sp.]